MNHGMSCADLPGKLATVLGNDEKNYTSEKCDIDGHMDTTGKNSVDENVSSLRVLKKI